jgi:uncharacterized protein YtpQ (UPF0354 family)
MTTDSWKRAIAYLKARVPDNDPSPVLTLPDEDSPVLRDLGNGLLVSYLVDEGDRFSYVQTRHLVAAGATENELHMVAIDNLYALTGQHLRVQPYGAVFALFMEGHFEASVLLLDRVWEVSLTEHVGGDYLAVVPARDVLAFGDASSPTASAELRAIIDRVMTSEVDHPLSSSLFRRKGGTWEPYDA